MRVERKGGLVRITVRVAETLARGDLRVVTPSHARLRTAGFDPTARATFTFELEGGVDDAVIAGGHVALEYVP